MNKSADVDLQAIKGAENLTLLNELLTRSMKQMQIQQLIRGSNLVAIVESIITLASNAPAKEELFAAAILGRLAAVARGREVDVFSRVPELFSQEPPTIESLSDGDEKGYAARILGHADADWLTTYCVREALAIDAANNARKELFRVLLAKTGNIADCIRLLTGEQTVIKAIGPPDARIKRIRRILDSLTEVIRSFDGDVGRDPGVALSALVAALVRGTTSADTEAVHAVFDSAISILVRMIELRFSHALHSETYQLLQDGKKLLDPGAWARFIEASTMIHKVQINLLEAALVLARQNRTDREILKAMKASWTSVATITTAIKRHFKDAVDVDPEVADYWLKVGRISQSERAAEHKLGNTEDQQIGELLIQLDANRDCMDKLNSAVVPVLKTFDHFQAATVQRAATGYLSIAQVAERLARMRKLSKTNLLGNVLEYNPIEHDMEGGHRSGIRRVKVVRDGILKEFGGKKKTLVRPRVEPEE